jgi:hypothetical protein
MDPLHFVLLHDGSASIFLRLSPLLFLFSILILPTFILGRPLNSVALFPLLPVGLSRRLLLLPLF